MGEWPKQSHKKGYGTAIRQVVKEAFCMEEEREGESFGSDLGY